MRKDLNRRTGILNLGLLITVDASHWMFRRTSDDSFKVQVIANGKFLHFAGSSDQEYVLLSDLITKALQVRLSPWAKFNHFGRASLEPSPNIATIANAFD